MKTEAEAREPDYDAEMRLPAGKTCGDCVLYRRCKAFFGCPATNTSCDWHPCRFKERGLPVVSSEPREGVNVPPLEQDR